MTRFVSRFCSLLLLTSAALLAHGQHNPHAANPHAAVPAPAAPSVAKRFRPADFPLAPLQRDVAYLASDELEGRYTGSEGARKAADYLVQQLKALGAKPLPGLGTYEHPFEFTTEVRADMAQSKLQYQLPQFAPAQALPGQTDFRPLSFSTSDSASGSLVFAGYGLSVPSGYDSYANADVTGKVVLVLNGIPAHLPLETRATLNRYADLRYKAAAAKQRGAVGLLVVNGPGHPDAGKLVPLSYDRSAADAGLVALSVQMATAEALLQLAQRNLARLVDSLDRASSPLAAVPIPGVDVYLRAQVLPVKRPDRNVVACLPATVPAATEYIVLGAHYDHLGRGETGSLSGTHDIHNGADDNASGTAAVLALARRLAREPVRKRHVLIAFWSGEELGLVGSSQFVQHPPQGLALSQLKAYLNFDMVGRLDKQLQVQGTGSSPQWPALVAAANQSPDSLPLSLQADPYLPTDVTSFYPQGVPVLAFFTGSHADYHKPTDDADRIHYAGIQRVAALAATVALALTNADEPLAYARVTRTGDGMGRSGGPMRVVLGTIPDYAYEGKDGLKLSGVRPGSPADAAGMQAGDLLVELAGKSIASIYDYMYLLGALKPGEQVPATVLRAGQRVQLKVTPASR